MKVICLRLKSLINITCYLKGNENYATALKLLEKRFGNETFISDNILALNNLPFVSSDEDVTGSRYFYDSLETNIQPSHSLNVDTSSYSQLLTPMVLECLPQTVRLLLHWAHSDQSWDLTKVLDTQKSILCKFPVTKRTQNCYHS